MGKLEREAKKRRRKGEVQDAVLATLAVTGVLAVALIAPNALAQLRYLPRNKYEFAHRAKTAAGRLVKKGYAEWVKEGGKTFLRITEKGEKAVEFEKEKVALETRKKKKWDGRWRMVVFDIPQQRENTRQKLRLTMREVGFVRLQDSVWVYPYDCEDFIALLKANLKTGKEVLYAIAEMIENDKSLREHYKLPPK